jgi:tRNA pseudouridine55 synthase
VPVFVIDKPLHLTSHDVVGKARKLLRTRRVGHAGTLDPLATGVLLLLTEEATKLSPFLIAHRKSYLAWVAFGAATPTLDAEGPIIEEITLGTPEAETINDHLPHFLALREQLPPQYSAIKKAGVKGYEAARRGETISLEARPAGYSTIQLLATAPSLSQLPKAFTVSQGSWHPAKTGIAFELPPPLGDYPGALFYLSVQAGTYIRAFARDLGRLLNVPSHLAGLVRVASGNLTLQQATTLEALPSATGIPMAQALPYPIIQLEDSEVQRVRQGQRLPLTFEGRVSLVSESGDLVAVAEAIDEKMKLLRVWA